MTNPTTITCVLPRRRSRSHAMSALRIFRFSLLLAAMRMNELDLQTGLFGLALLIRRSPTTAPNSI
jgi:hypothetical protein